MSNKIYVNRNSEIVNPKDDKSNWMNENNKTFTRQQVEHIMDKAVHWMSANFDSYISRSDYLPLEFKEFIVSLLDNPTK